MIDTIILKVYNSTNHQIEALYKCLSSKSNNFVTGHYIKDDLPAYFKGKIKSMVITKSQSNTIKISGSLSEYHYGSNIKTLNFNDLQLALISLEKDLGISLTEAVITRLDISSVVNTKHKPKTYYSSLFDISHKTRNEQNSGLYFNSKNETVVFYDKGKKNKIEGNNYHLRYEYRILSKGKIKKMLLIDRFENLKSEEVYDRLLKFWYDAYVSIDKEEKVYDIDCINSVSGLRKFLYALGVDQLGGVPAVIKLIHRLAGQKIISSGIVYKCKGAVTDLYKGPTGKIQNKLVNELNKAIKDEYDRLLVRQ